MNQTIDVNNPPVPAPAETAAKPVSSVEDKTASADSTSTKTASRKMNPLPSSPAKLPSPALNGKFELRMRRASSVQPKPIKWLWPGRIPKGKITVLCGDPGFGKGLVSVDLIAALTTGRAFPDGPNTNPPIEVAMLFCEDGAEDTVRPRLDAAGADVNKVHFPDSILKAKHKTEKDRMLALDTDISYLRNALNGTPSIKLVVIDPASSYLGGAKMEKEQEIRRVFAPLAELAETTDVAFLLVMHNNKRSDVRALHRVMGAVAMSGVARAVWMCAQDQDNPEEYLFLCSKMNIARMPKGLRYGIEGKNHPIAGEIGCVSWKGEVDISANQALGIKSAEDGKLLEAKEWLSSYLDSDKSAKSVFEAAEQEGISEKTLKRAKKTLGIESEKTVEGWIWMAKGAKSGR